MSHDESRGTDVHALIESTDDPTFRKAATAVRENPSNEGAWDALEDWAAKTQNPDPASAVYRVVLAGTLSRERASELGQRALRFHEEWFSEDSPQQLEVLSRVLEHDPEAEWAFQRLTVVFTSRERWPELLATYDRAIASASDAGRREQLLEEAYQTARDFAADPAASVRYLEQLVALRPKDVALAQNLERLLERNERWDDLVRFLRAQLPSRGAAEQHEVRLRVFALLGDKLGDVRRALEEARALLAAPGDAAVVVAALERIVATDTEDSDVRRDASALLRARYERDGRTADLVRLLDAEIALVDPKRQAALHVEAGERLAAEGKATEALVHFADALALAPADADVRARLRSLAESTSQQAKLVSVLEGLAGSVEDAALRVGFRLESASLRRGPLRDAAGAIDVLVAVLAEPALDGALVLATTRDLVDLYGATGRAEERLGMLEQLAGLETDATRKRRILGDAARLATELGMPDRALSAWEQRLSTDPNDHEAVEAIVALLEREERWEALVAAIRRRFARSTSPFQRRADLVRIARLESDKLERRADAIRTWLEVAAEFGEDSEVVDALVGHYTAEERYADLAELLSRAEQNEGVHLAQVRARLGDTYRQYLGRPDLAARAYRRALEADARHDASRAGLAALADDPTLGAEAVEGLARSYAQTGEWEPELALLEPRLAATPEDSARVRLLREAAQIQEEKAGVPQVALGSLVRAFALAPTDVGIEAEIERLAESTGDRASAAEGFRAAAAAIAGDPERKAALLEKEATFAETALGDRARALASYAEALRNRPRGVPLAEAVLRNAEAVGDLATAEAVLREVAADEATPLAMLEHLAALERRHPDAGLVGTLERIAERRGTDLDALVEAASVGSSGAVDDARVTKLAERTFERAATLLRRGEPASGKRTPAEAATWALETLLARYGAAGEHAKVLATSLEGARLPLPSGLVVSLRRKAAEIAVALGQRATAIELYREVLSADPSDAASFLALGGMLESEGRLGELLSLRKQELDATTDRERRLSLRLEVASIVAQIEATGGRVEALKANLEDAPGHRPSIEALTDVLSSTARYRELAEVLTRQAQLVEPAQSAELSRTVARLAVDELEDDDLALASYRRVVEIAPDAEALEALARIHETREESAQAARWLERRLAMATAEEKSVVALRLARALFEAERGDRAVEVLEEVRRRDPSNVEARELLVAEYRRTHAQAPLGALLWETSDHVADAEARRAAVREAATIYYDVLGRPADAIPMLAKAVELSPEDRALRLELAEALRSGQRVDEARSVLEAAIEEFGRRRSPERAAVHFLLGRTLREAGDLAGALEQVEQATQMAMTNAPMLLELGRLAREAGQIDRAEKAYRTLLVLVRRRGADEVVEVGVGEVLYELATIAGARGESDKEKELLDSALEAASSSDGEALRFVEALAPRGAGELALRGLDKRLEAVEGSARVPLLRAGARLLDATLGRSGEALARSLEALAFAFAEAEVRTECRAIAKRANASAKYVEGLGKALGHLRREEDEQLVAELLFAQGDVAEHDLADLASARAYYERCEDHEHGGRVAEALRSLARVANAQGDAREERRALGKLVSHGGVGRSARIEALYRLGELETRDDASLAEGVAHLREAFGADARSERAARILGDLARRTLLDADTLRFHEEVARGSGDDALLVEFLELRAARPDATLPQLREAVDRVIALGREELAERFLLRAAEVAESVGPEEARAVLGQLADLREKKGDLGGAIGYLERAVAFAQGSDRRDLRLRVAGLATRSGVDLAAAARAYRDLLDDEPTNPEIYLPLLRVLASLGEEDALNDLVASLLDQLPEPAQRNEVRMEKAKFLAPLEGRQYDAVDVLKAGLEDAPDDTEVSAFLARIYEQSGYDEELVALLRQQLDVARDKQDLEQIVSVGSRLGALLEKVDREGAMDVYRSALEWAPEERSLLEALLALFGPEDDLRERAELRERLIATEPGSTATRLALSVAAEWEALSDEAGTLRAIAAGHRRNPSDPVLRAKLEEWYRSRGDDENLASFLVVDADGLVDQPEERRSRLFEAASIYRDRLGRPGDAADVIRKAAGETMDLATLEELVACLEAAEDHPGALAEVSRHVDTLATDDASKARLLVLRARPAMALDRLEDAIVDLEAAYALDRLAAEGDLVAALVRARIDAQTSSQRDVERERTLRLVDVLDAAGEASQARDVLAEWTHRTPDDVEALVRLREVDLASGNWPGVRETAEMLVAATAGEAQVEATLLFVDACARTERPERARGVLEHVLVQQPFEPRLLEKLREVYVQLGAFRELAHLLLQESTQAEPERRFELSSEAGRILIEKVGDAEAAIVPLEHAHQAKPDDHKTIVALADAYTDSGRHAEAGQLLEHAINAHPKRRTPELSQLQHRMARLARAAGDRSLDYQWMSASLECDKNNVDVAAELAYLAMELGEHEAALNALRAITLAKTEGSMSRAMAFLLQARIAFQRGEARRALLWARKAREVDPNLQEAEDFLRELGDG
ncbi:MAG: tetratricopeptide repeat protein [Polyangiales bacterium]